MRRRPKHEHSTRQRRQPTKLRMRAPRLPDRRADRNSHKRWQPMMAIDAPAPTSCGVKARYDFGPLYVVAKPPADSGPSSRCDRHRPRNKGRLAWKVRPGSGSGRSGKCAPRYSVAREGSRRPEGRGGGGRGGRGCDRCLQRFLERSSVWKNQRRPRRGRRAAAVIVRWTGRCRPGNRVRDHAALRRATVRNP